MSNTQLIRLGWWLFVVSAVFFGASALRAGDWVAAAGAAAFLAANISFMIPVYRGEHGRTGPRTGADRRSGRNDEHAA